MKILVYGQGKSGTTALFYKIRNSMAVEPFELFEPHPAKVDEERLSRSGDILAKCLIGRQGLRFFEKLVGFDRKVLIVRDPRDNLISRILYSVRDRQPDESAVKQLLALIRQKEQDPRAVSVRRLVQWHDDVRPGKARLPDILGRALASALKHDSLFPDRHVIRYEELVDGELGELEKYLGFPLEGSSEPDRQHRDVLRTGGYGDWKNWFVAEDVEYFSEFFREYMEAYGYSDWAIPEFQEVKPEHGSDYVARMLTRTQARQSQGAS